MNTPITGATNTHTDNYTTLNTCRNTITQRSTMHHNNATLDDDASGTYKTNTNIGVSSHCMTNTHTHEYGQY